MYTTLCKYNLYVTIVELKRKKKEEKKIENLNRLQLSMNYRFGPRLINTWLFMNYNRRSRLRARYGLVFLWSSTGGGVGQRYLQPGTFVQQKSTRQRDRYGLRNWSMHGIKKRDVLESKLRWKSMLDSRCKRQDTSLCA